MKKDVILKIRGRQLYEDEEPDVIELTTEGTLEQKREDLWLISYEESDLTGLEGTKTVFRVQPEEITLGRVGAVHSRMVFREGMSYESLYQVDAGALMLSVCTDKIHWELSEQGGYIHISYSIVIEHTAKGTVDYEVWITTK